MDKRELIKLVERGEILIVTRSAMKKAVVENVIHLYQDDGSFDKNHYANERTFVPLSKRDCEDIASDVLDHLLAGKD